MTKKEINIFIDIVIVILEIIGWIITIPRNGWSVFGYYTQESNALLLIVLIIYLTYVFRKSETPRWLEILKYMAVCCVTVTLCMVTFVFVPYVWPSSHEAALNFLFSGSNISFHLLCPLLALISYIFLEQDYKPDMRGTLFATLPTLLYAIVSTSLNVAKVVRGPYDFLFVYEQPVALSVLYFFLIPFTGWIFACLIRWLHNKMAG